MVKRVANLLPSHLQQDWERRREIQEGGVMAFTACRSHQLSMRSTCKREKTDTPTRPVTSRSTNILCLVMQIESVDVHIYEP